MCDEHAHHMVEMVAIMVAIEDQEPIQTLRANCPHEPLRDAVRLRRTKGRENDLYPFGLKDPVKTLCELLIPVANQVAELSGRSAKVHVSCRACCVTHGPFGFGVQPAKCTRRVPSSMKKST